MNLLLPDSNNKTGAGFTASPVFPLIEGWCKQMDNWKILPRKMLES